jgi:hypothetical protein
MTGLPRCSVATEQQGYRFSDHMKDYVQNHIAQNDDHQNTDDRSNKASVHGSAPIQLWNFRMQASIFYLRPPRLNASSITSK